MGLSAALEERAFCLFIQRLQSDWWEPAPCICRLGWSDGSHFELSPQFSPQNNVTAWQLKGYGFSCSTWKRVFTFCSAEHVKHQLEKFQVKSRLVGHIHCLKTSRGQNPMSHSQRSASKVEQPSLLSLHDRFSAATR